jgi:hypothetical protein
MSTAFSMSNLATFVKEPLYKLRRRKWKMEWQRRYRDHHTKPRRRILAAPAIAIHFSTS